MLEQHLKSPVTRQRLRSGPAADRIDGFADWLHRHRYSPITIDTTLRSLAGWTDWMRAAGFTEHDLPCGVRVVLGGAPPAQIAPLWPGIMRSAAPSEPRYDQVSGDDTSHNHVLRIIRLMRSSA